MASLNWYLTTLGKKAGRKAYNAYHREYRKNNHERRLEVQRKYRESKKVDKILGI